MLLHETVPTVTEAKMLGAEYDGMLDGFRGNVVEEKRHSNKGNADGLYERDITNFGRVAIALNAFSLPLLFSAIASTVILFTTLYAPTGLSRDAKNSCSTLATGLLVYSVGGLLLGLFGLFSVIKAHLHVHVLLAPFIVIEHACTVWYVLLSGCTMFCSVFYLIVGLSMQYNTCTAPILSRCAIAEVVTFAIFMPCVFGCQRCLRKDHVFFKIDGGDY